jgi:hypothetical protein
VQKQPEDKMKKKTTSRYSSVVVNGKRRPEHVVIWEDATGRKLPKGWVLHHIDGNGKNNELSNLLPMTIAEHVLAHQQMRSQGCDVVDSSDPAVKSSRERSRKYREKHCEEIAEKKRAYYELHKEEIRAKHRAYQRQYHKDHASKEKEYRTTSAEFIRLRTRLRYKKKRGYDMTSPEVQDIQRQMDALRIHRKPVYES